jgi:hypothetical protein
LLGADGDGDGESTGAAEGLEGTWHLSPLGGDVFCDCMFTSGPGLGNMTSFCSVVVQPLPTLATNISGRVAKDCPVPRRFCSLLFPSPLTLMAAQFMYISRLPT